MGLLCQVPPGARPGATLLVDVGGGLAVPTLAPHLSGAVFGVLFLDETDQIGQTPVITASV